MPAAPIIAIGAAVVGAGAAVYGTVKQAQAAKKQTKYNNEALAVQRQQANMSTAIQKRDAIRAARLSAGQALQTGENQGVSGSSAAYGGFGSIQSQLSSNLSFLDKYNTLSDQASIAAGKANKAGTAAQVFGSVAGLGITLMNNADRIGSVFK